ncbi:hypothetical protein Tco_1461925 [Tanacetum coccineum]
MLRSTNIQMEYAVKDTSKGILGTTDLSNNCDNRLTQGTNMSVPNLCATPQCYQNSRRSPFTGKSRTCLHHLQCDHTDAIRYFRIIHEQQTWLVACNELKSRDDVKDVFILSEKLHSAISQFDQLRGVRFQDAINRAMPRKKPGRAKTSIDTYYFGNCLESREPTSSKTINHGEIPAEPMKVQQHLLDDETRTLQVSSNDYSVFDSMLIRGSDTI